ncbi:hypothetical protein nbrc107696_29910 [Gordonia spumicola]|uniref:Pyrrolo-quinoline quinone repeat domain-containing protein n=1 Tax=Gordonia spumicola TaxID=589161 RepID=A0A7I9VB58_9ACTN|nr:PQQ-binding-like beta-propeller repeat protein [Gordonia spumicola]GEE02545.1 hypothetical protein nbrc107696_29910 [Gordonia spumicola]
MSTAELERVAVDEPESFDLWSMPFLGIGAIVGSIYLAARSLTVSPITRDGGFSAVQGQVAWTIIVAGVIAVAATGSVVVRRDVRGVTLAVRAMVGVCWIAVFAVACGSGMFLGDRYHGPNHSAAMSATWFSLVGMLVAMMLRRAPRDRSRLAPVRESAKSAVVAVLIPLIVAVAITQPWKSDPIDDADTRGDLVVELADTHPWTDSPPPRRVTLAPTRITSDVKPSSWSRHDEPVGGGFVTSNLEMVNADTGTVRWRIDGDSLDYRSSTFVDSVHSLVVISQPHRTGGPTTTAIDAETGTVRWTQPVALTTWEHGYQQGKTLIGTGVLATITPDARIMRALSPTDGTPTWDYRVGSECAIVHVESRPMLSVMVGCAGRGVVEHILDPDTGRLVAGPLSVDTQDSASRALAPVGDRFRATAATTGRAFNYASGVIDTRTGRTVARRSGADGSGMPLTCDATADCLMRTTGGRGELVSLTGAHPPIAVNASTVNAERAIWLADQILWVDDVKTGRLVVVDRTSGAVTTTPVPAGSLAVVPGAVLLREGTTLLRFEGKA